jgi:hypothetical protein
VFELDRVLELLNLLTRTLGACLRSNEVASFVCFAVASPAKARTGVCRKSHLPLEVCTARGSPMI